MTNRVTDQSTQNALIKKYRLEGLLAEMQVASIILPVVNVGSVDEAQNTGEFERWRSVFQGGPSLVDPLDLTRFTVAFATGVIKVAPTSHVISDIGAWSYAGSGIGAKLPSGGVGVDATDGIYRITLKGLMAPVTENSGDVSLYDQAAFGDPVAIGTFRSKIGTWHGTKDYGSGFTWWDTFVKIPESLNCNAVVFTSVGGVVGSGSIEINVTKLIDVLPPVVIFP